MGVPARLVASRDGFCLKFTSWSYSQFGFQLILNFEGISPTAVNSKADFPAVPWCQDRISSLLRRLSALSPGAALLRGTVLYFHTLNLWAPDTDTQTSGTGPWTSGGQPPGSWWLGFCVLGFVCFFSSPDAFWEVGAAAPNQKWAQAAGPHPSPGLVLAIGLRVWFCV